VIQSQTNSQVLMTGEMPVLVKINGIPYWQASGRTFPLVAGAEDPPSDAQNDSGGDEDDFDKERALRTIKKQREETKAAREEARALKERLDALEADKRKREDADKSETEKALARLEELTKAQAEAADKAAAAEAKLKQVQVDRAIEQAAGKHGARNPAVIARLLDRDALEFDDAGVPSNAEDLVKALLKDEPYLVASDTDDGGNRRTGVPASPRSTGQPRREDRVKEAEEKLIATRQYNPIG